MKINASRKKIAKYGMSIIGILCLALSFVSEGVGASVAFSIAVLSALCAHFIGEDVMPVLTPQQIIECPYCKKTSFKEEDELNVHILTEHREEFKKAIGGQNEEGNEEYNEGR